jgi:hypothetical protein
LHALTPITNTYLPTHGFDMDDSEDTTTGNPSTFLNLDRSGGDGDSGSSPLEQDVLDEYARLAKNMKTVRTVFIQRVHFYRAPLRVD